MIFITVGTHEQQFNRVLIEVDKLIDEGIIKEKVFAQIGFSDYTPRNYRYSKMIAYDEMNKRMDEARINITHGGPGSIFMSLDYSKIPIVVPRQFTFDEHVNDHQVDFARRLEGESKVIPIYNICELKNSILNYDTISGKMDGLLNSNRELLIKKLDKYTKKISNRKRK